VVETPYPVYFDQALNCARILARIIPFMLEKKSQSINELFWNKQVIPRPPQAPSGNGNEEDKGGESDTDELQETEPLAVILVNSMFHLLFLPGHTSRPSSLSLTSPLPSHTFFLSYRLHDRRP
jgi:hypothetical protein